MSLLLVEDLICRIKNSNPKQQMAGLDGLNFNSKEGREEWDLLYTKTHLCLILEMANVARPAENAL